MIKSRDVSSAPVEVAGRSEPGGSSTRIDLCGGHIDAVVKKDIPSPTARIDIDRMDMGSLVKRSEESAVSRKERLLSAQEKHPRSMTGRGELTLTGEIHFTGSGTVVKFLQEYYVGHFPLCGVYLTYTAFWKVDLFLY